MTGKRLLEEGFRLARPCIHLVTQKSEHDEIAAVWKGPGVVAAPSGRYRHWLSLNRKFLPNRLYELEGCLSIYTNEVDSRSGAVTISTSRSVAVRGDAIPLFARREVSLPPIDAVFKFGSIDILQWLFANHWRRDWGYNSNFADAEVAHEYIIHYQRSCPLFCGGVHAVLGGWHFPWPDDDWGQLIDQQLVAWTMADSEPWVEVWYENSFRVIQRIT